MSSACELVSNFSSNCSKSAALIEMDSVTALVDLVSNHDSEDNQSFYYHISITV